MGWKTSIGLRLEMLTHQTCLNRVAKMSNHSDFIRYLSQEPTEFLTHYFPTSVFSNGFQHPEQKSKDMGSQVI